MSKVFPIAIATGEAFCNRKKERERLTNNMKNTRHTVLLSPRRYGKTSLVTEVLRQLKYPYCQIDFLMCGNSDAVQVEILKKAGELLHQLLPKTAKLRDKILNIFRVFKPEATLTIPTHGVTASVKLFEPSGKVDTETTISDVLEKLDEAAGLAKKHVVVFMDEFQQIGLLRDQYVVEAAIRHAVQLAKNVSYVFSGSNRHLLLQMFSDHSRPFYSLCQTYPIERIAEKEHIAFIQKHAKTKWKNLLADDTIKTIMQLSASHPYYVNLICNYFWTQNECPTKKKVEAMWKEYIATQRSTIASCISRVSNNQKIILKYFSEHPSNQPYGKQVRVTTQLTSASIKQALNKLIEEDLLYVDKLNFLRVLDPAMECFINHE